MTSVANLDRRRSAPALGTFERYLTVWVALCIIAGIVLGQLLPAPFQVLGRMNMAEVNIPVAVLIVPMLLKVDFGAFHQVAGQWRGIAVTVGINWLIKPFSMALPGSPAGLADRASCDACAAVRIPGRADRPPAADHRATGGTDHHPGLSQCRHRLRAQSRPRCSA